MSKCIIKAQMNPVGGGNPEFAPDKELEDGIEADGFLLLTMKGGKPGVTVIYGLSTMDMARLFACQEDGADVRQAIAIAEGLEKASEIAKKNIKAEIAKTLAEIMKRE